MDRFRVVVEHDREKRHRQDQLEGIKRAGGSAARSAEDRRSKKAKGKAKVAAKLAAALVVTDTAKPEPIGMSAFIKNDAKERGYCFAFQRGTCTKGKSCSYKRQLAKTRDRSSDSGSSRGGRGKGRGKGKGADADGRHSLVMNPVRKNATALPTCLET